MKQLLVFIMLIMLAWSIDLKPYELMRNTTDQITVTIQGEVEQEGTYTFDMYTTLGEAIDEAGILEGADLDTLNRETVLKDHDVIVVPEKQPDEPRISINTASAGQLCTLRGIGPSTAARIIEYREENGLFQTLEDLMRVKGIGSSTFEKIRDQICL